MTHNEKGSATVMSLLTAVLLATALAVAVLWSAISTARHKLTTAADLTALSAASDTSTPCATAARIADLHRVQLIACHPTPSAVTVEVALQLHFPFAHPTLTTTARAGPV